MCCVTCTVFLFSFFFQLSDSSNLAQPTSAAARLITAAPMNRLPNFLTDRQGWQGWQRKEQGVCTNTGRLGSNERNRNLYIGRGRLAGREMIRGPEVRERL